MLILLLILVCVYCAFQMCHIIVADWGLCCHLHWGMCHNLTWTSGDILATTFQKFQFLLKKKSNCLTFLPHQQIPLKVGLSFLTRFFTHSVPFIKTPQRNWAVDKSCMTVYQTCTNCMAAAFFNPKTGLWIRKSAFYLFFFTFFAAELGEEKKPNKSKLCFCPLLNALSSPACVPLWASSIFIPNEDVNQTTVTNIFNYSKSLNNLFDNIAKWIILVIAMVIKKQKQH